MTEAELTQARLEAMDKKIEAIDVLNKAENVLHNVDGMIANMKYWFLGTAFAIILAFITIVQFLLSSHLAG